MAAAAPSGWQAVLQDAWTHRGVLAWSLWPVSLVYGTLVALRRRFYRWGWLRSARVNVPVIVIGNVVAGGGGKTPAVMAIISHLRSRGLQSGVVSRGYGRREHDCLEVQTDSAPDAVGDEPLLIHRLCKVPVFVAPGRVDAARALLAHHPQTQVIVCDDGLQHLALERDIEICVFDERGVGNGFLLPAGPLREPWPRPMDLVLHTGRRAMAQGYGSHRALASFAVRADGTRVSLAALRNKPLRALAGIARPEAFFSMLREQGLQLREVIALPDHYGFESWIPPSSGEYELLCTEKDAVKLWRQHPGAWAVPLEFSPEPAFGIALDAALNQLPGISASGPLSSPDGHQTT